MNHLHIPSSKVHFEWKVKDLQILHNYHYGDKIITLSSQTFGTGRFKWVLNIELDIRAMGHDDHLRIYLRQFDPSIEFDNLVNTKYVIYILRGETRTIISRSTFAFGTQQSLGSTLIPAARLLYAADFSLCCDIEAVTYTQLEHYGKFTDMFENGLFSDCVIRVKYQGESVKEIKAHRCVLTTNEVFGTAFTTDMSEARDRVVTITDFCYETVRALVKFLYSGFIDSDILHVHFYDIYAIAHKYQVPFLMYECEKFCSSRIDNETFVIYCKIIVRYEAPILMQACASYFLVNRENFVNTNEWGEVVATYPDLSDRFLNCRDDI